MLTLEVLVILGGLKINTDTRMFSIQNEVFIELRNEFQGFFFSFFSAKSIFKDNIILKHFKGFNILIVIQCNKIDNLDYQ